MNVGMWASLVYLIVVFLFGAVKVHKWYKTKGYASNQYMINAIYLTGIFMGFGTVSFLVSWIVRLL